jgi:hypothetical protein
MANLPDLGVVQKSYPWNINHMPAVKFFACLDFDQIYVADGSGLLGEVLNR